jgi:hypothetical protein
MIPRTRITELWQMHSMLELLGSAQGQSVMLGGPNEGPFIASLQKFGVLPERATTGRS